MVKWAIYDKTRFELIVRDIHELVTSSNTQSLTMIKAIHMAFAGINRKFHNLRFCELYFT